MNRDRIPIKPGLLHRSQVNELLERGLDYPLILVKAGPGYGKTQAVAMFASEIKQRVIWLNLTRLDNDTGHFWNTLVSATRYELPDFAAKLRHYEFPRTIREFDDHIMAAAGALEFTHDTVFVVDNFSLVRAKPIRWFIENLIRLQLVRLCVILIVNRKEDEGIGEALVGRDYYEINMNALRFSQEDVKLLFNFNGLDIKETDLALVMEETEGWPLAIYLVCQQYMKFGLDTNGPLVPLRTEMTQLFQQSFFQTFDPELKKLLVCFSFLPSFSLEMVRSITPERAEQFAGNVLNNVFISYDYNNGVFTFHRMYQDFLKHQQYVVSDDDLMAAYETAGDWFSAHNLYLEAIECYSNCRAFEKMIKSIFSLPVTRRDTTAIDLILKYLKNIPRTFVESNPYATFCLAAMYISRMEVNKGLSLLESIKDKLERKKRNDRENVILGEIYAAIGDISLLKNGSDFYLNYKKALDSLGKGRLIQHRIVQAVHNNSILFIPGQKTGQLEDITKKIKSGANLAEHIFEEQTYGYELLFAAEAAYAQGLLKQTRENSRRAIQKALDKKQHDIVCNSYFMLMQSAVFENKYIEVVQVLSTLLDYIKRNKFAALEEIGDYAVGWLYLRLNMPDKVARWIAEYDHIHYALLPISVGRNKVIHALYLVEKHRYRECITFLEDMEWVYKEKGLWTTRLHHHILKAISLNNIGFNEMAVRSLFLAYSMAYKNKVIMYFIIYGNRMRSLINLAMNQSEYQFDLEWLQEIKRKAADYAENIIVMRKNFLSGNQTVQKKIKLSGREHEVLRLMAYGLTRNEISKKLGLSVNSVKTYIAGIYNKLGAVNKADAIRLALSLGIYSDLK